MKKLVLENISISEKFINKKLIINYSIKGEFDDTK